MDCGKCEENIATYEPKLLDHPDFSVIEEFVQAGGKLADDNDKDIIRLRNLFGVITPILSELKWGEQRIAECPDCGSKMIVALSSVNGHAHVVCEKMRCQINAIVLQADQVSGSAFLVFSVLNTNLINPLVIKTFTYSQSITLAPNGGQEIRIPITVPDGYMFLCVTNVKSNGNVAYACYIASSSNVLTCFVGNDRNEQKIIPQGISADALFVKKWW